MKYCISPSNIHCTKASQHVSP